MNDPKRDQNQGGRNQGGRQQGDQPGRQPTQPSQQPVGPQPGGPLPDGKKNPPEQLPGFNEDPGRGGRRDIEREVER